MDDWQNQVREKACDLSLSQTGYLITVQFLVSAPPPPAM